MPAQPRRQLPCRECAELVTLHPSWINRRTLTCDVCLARHRLQKLLHTAALADRVPQPWVRALLQSYASFLEIRGFSTEGRWRKVREVSIIGRRMGEELLGPEEITDLWLGHALPGEGRSRGTRSSLSVFLKFEKFVPEATAEERWLQSISRSVARVPDRFRRGVERYTAFRVGVQREQRRQELRRVLALRTIASDVRILCRFADYLEGFFPAVTGWDTVNEGEVVDYLLHLGVNPNSRNVQRWDLHAFFAFALRHRLVAHNPVPGEPGRESASTFRPLTLEQQRELLDRWARLDDPLEGLVGCLALLHGLGASQVQGLRLGDLDRGSQQLRVKGRPVPLPLDPLTWRVLEGYLAIRPSGPAFEHNTHLILSDRSRSTAGPVSGPFFGRPLRRQRLSVRALRMTCFATVAQESGPRLLVDAFGLSPTQADRYQRFLAYRADAALNAHQLGPTT